MLINRLVIQQFRCFDQFELTINSPCLVVSGANGAGKSALCEALYYTCYARSFRTHTPRELIKFGTEHFVLKLALTDEHGDGSVHIGVTPSKKLIKYNERPLRAARELMHVVPVVAFTQQDVEVVVGGPLARRTFIDQYGMLADTAYALQVYKLRSIVDNRNALLNKRCTDRELLEPWTRALWHQSVMINTARNQAIEQLNSAVAQLVQQLGLGTMVNLRLSERNALDSDFDSFLSHNSNFLQQELFCGRSLFGAHLDDILIDLNGIPARSFASRGQQKLVAFLLKSAQVVQLIKQGTKPVFVLDDIMVDFDEYHMQRVIGGVCSFDCQLILTCAQHASQLAAMVGEHKTQHLVL